MNVKIESSRIIKPLYEGTPPSTTTHIPFNIFDNVTFDALMALIYAYRPPTPPTSTIETGLRKTLAVYREWAGRIGQDSHGNRGVFLNDEGVRFIEASVDASLDQVLPLKPSPSMLSLHPSLKDVVELIQVQVTRFTCGSVVVGFTGHHMIADGHAASNFFVAWGQACRGLEINPLPLNDRAIFHPRDPPLIEYNHVGAEFISKLGNKELISSINNEEKNIIVHKVHFTLEFLGKLKANASYMKGKARAYSTFESLVAHLWRVITKSRGLPELQKTQIRISVDGRRRVIPRIPDEFFGNIVLWAFPTSKVKDLLDEPLHYATKIIHDAITKVDDKYFKSFIDFANDDEKMSEDLMPSADMKKDSLCPNLEVDSWLRFPFYDLDFGNGCPFVFMPSYYPIEGMMFLVPSFIGDGSIDAFIPLFEDNLPSFKKICYSLDLKAK